MLADAAPLALDSLAFGLGLIAGHRSLALGSLAFGLGLLAGHRSCLEVVTLHRPRFKWFRICTARASNGFEY